MNYLKILQASFRECLREPLLLLFLVERLYFRLTSNTSIAHISKHSAQKTYSVERLDLPDDLNDSNSPFSGSLAVDVLLSHECTIRRSIHLPQSALKNPRHWIKLAINNLHPETTSDLYFDFRFRADKCTGNKVGFDLVMVSSDRIQEWINQLQRRGYFILSITAEDGWQGNNLLPLGYNKQFTWQSVARGISIPALLVFGLFLAWNIPLWRHQHAIHDMDSQILNLSPKAQEAEKLANNLSRRINAFQTLIEQRRSSLPIVDIILELTNLHSDASWVRSIKISEGEIIIRGEAKDVAALLERLEKSPMFEKAEIRGPIIKIKGSFYEAYHIRMQLTENASK